MNHDFVSTRGPIFYMEIHPHTEESAGILSYRREPLVMSDSMTNIQQHSGTLTISRNKQRQVCVMDERNRILDTGLPNRPDSLCHSPVQYLALALGICLTEFAQRFLLRRHFPAACTATLTWEVDHGPRCCIDRIDVALYMAVELSEQENNTLLLMLGQCPVHKAIHGNIRTSIKICHSVQTGSAKQS